MRQIPVERGDLSISMPMLRSGPSSQTFHEINENYDCHNAEVKCKTDSLLERSLANGRGNSDGNLSVSESGFLNQREKSQFHPVQHLEFLGVNVNSIKMELTLPSENINKIICQCKDILNQDRVSILNFLGKLTSRLQWREINIYKEEETSRQI